MGKAHNPRHGSMQFWPRVRASRPYARVRTFLDSKDVKLLGFPGYKAGMTHCIVTENRKTSPNKGADVSVPVTIIECPPVKIAGVRTYKKAYLGMRAKDTLMAKQDKELQRKMTSQKKEHSLDSLSLDGVEEIRAIIQTQPKQTGIGKKKPEVFEMAVGGSMEEQLTFLKENFGKEVAVKDVLGEGQQVDVFAITTGKGFQGPVKRFGVSIRAKKSEKTKRGPGSLGGWKGHAHFMYRIAHAGQMGYHQRVDYNKQILKISDNPDEVNPQGGLVNFGLVKNTYVLLRGSVPGPKKRLIRLEPARRPTSKLESQAPAIQMISQRSQQKR